MDEKLLADSENVVESWKFESWIKTFAIGIISEVGEAFYGVPALPSLTPRRFVQLYYLFKFMFEGFLIATCVYYSEGIKTVTNAIDLITILSDEIFSDIWWYWIVGIFCFVFGGVWSFSYMDTKQWGEWMWGSEDVLLKLMRKKKFSLVERALENGEEYFYKIIDRAMNELEDNTSFDTKEWCVLLFEMVENGIISLGPPRRLTTDSAKKLKYRKFLIPALLSECNYSRTMDRRHILAKLLCDKLIENSNERNTLYCMIKDAGASLTFLRFHLQVNDNFFRKGGFFQCEAQELVKENFDILYCLDCGFSWTELKSGFEGLKDDYPIFNEQDVNLKMLKKYKEMLFAMNFTVHDLKQSGHFSDKDLQEWYKKYFEYQENTKSEEEESVDSVSYFSLNRGPTKIEMTQNNSEETKLSPRRRRRKLKEGPVDERMLSVTV